LLRGALAGGVIGVVAIVAVLGWFAIPPKPVSQPAPADSAAAAITTATTSVQPAPPLVSPGTTLVTPAQPLIQPSSPLITSTTTLIQPASNAIGPLSPERERALKPKDSFKECDNCPEMVVVAAGKFMMGSPDGEKDRGKDEGPQHVVTVSKPFAV